MISTTYRFFFRHTTQLFAKDWAFDRGGQGSGYFLGVIQCDFVLSKVAHLLHHLMNRIVLIINRVEMLAQDANNHHKDHICRM